MMLVCTDKLAKASAQNDAGPLQALVDIFPSNIFTALGEAKMLQVIFFALFVGICLLLIPEKKAKPLIKFFDSLKRSCYENGRFNNAFCTLCSVCFNSKCNYCFR